MTCRVLRRDRYDLSHLTIIQQGDDGSLDQGRSGSDEKWWHSGTILKAELTGFLHALGVGYERKRGVNDDYWVTGLKFKRILVPTAVIDKVAGEVGFRNKSSWCLRWDIQVETSSRQLDIPTCSLVPCTVSVKSFQNHDKSINDIFSGSLKAYSGKSPKHTRSNPMEMSGQIKW